VPLIMKQGSNLWHVNFIATCSDVKDDRQQVVRG